MLRFAALLLLAACQSFGSGYVTTGGMSESEGPPRRAMPVRDPLDSIALSDSQRVQVDSIRATYWLAAKSIGGPEDADDFDNLVKREIVDVRLVLTRPQQDIYDRHLAEKPPAEPDH